MIKKKIVIRQTQMNDCSLACLSTISYYHNAPINLIDLKKKIVIDKNEGVDLVDLKYLADSLGYDAEIIRTNSIKDIENSEYPSILHWGQNHYVVHFKKKGSKWIIGDPANGLSHLSEKKLSENFLKHEAIGNTYVGYILQLKPRAPIETPMKNLASFSGIKYFLRYAKKYKSLYLQLLATILIASIIQLIIPFITQSVIDIGLKNNDLTFIQLMIIAQFSLTIGRLVSTYLRSWILLNISGRLVIELLGDFIRKIFKLTFKFYERMSVGDLSQRMYDHRRIESFFTNSLINILFSFLNFILYSIIITFYNIQIFLIFLLGSVVYVVWISLFLKKRRELDQSRFNLSSIDNNYFIQTIQGIKELVLNSAQLDRVEKWKSNQINLFGLKRKTLILNQVQGAGSIFINEVKNISITYYSVVLIINGELTLGMLIAIQYIIGQLNQPVNSMIGLIQSGQDAKISLERIKEIIEEEDEVSGTLSITKDFTKIKFKNVNFSYPNSNRHSLNQITLEINKGSTTAIVGTSGSGKSTLLKMLLKFYVPESGNILINDKDLESIDTSEWRSNTKAILQGTTLFNESIEYNISLTYNTDTRKLKKVCESLGIEEFIESLPYSYSTEIGKNFNLSGGQTQRLLLARVLYQEPEIIILDESTNALDAISEGLAFKAVKETLSNKTIIIVAHRLKNIIDADHIIVMDGGQIVEQGTHSELLTNRNTYQNLYNNFNK